MPQITTRKNRHSNNPHRVCQHRGRDQQKKSAQLTSLQLACDMFVACYMEKYKEEEPRIGKIVAMHETSQNIDVEWMTGTHDDRWSVCKKTVGQRKVPSAEEIHESVILFPVEFTFYMQIKKEFIIKVKDAYKNMISYHNNKYVCTLSDAISLMHCI